MYHGAMIEKHRSIRILLDSSIVIGAKRSADSSLELRADSMARRLF